MRASSASSRTIAPALEGADDLGGEVVGGRPQPAARDDQVDADRGQERERAVHVLGPVADDDGVGVVDPELAQAVRQPRAVAVRHPPRQHLGAGDDDPRPRAHAPQAGRFAAGSGLTRPGGVISYPRIPPVGATARVLPLTRRRTSLLPSSSRKRFER